MIEIESVAMGYRLNGERVGVLQGLDLFVEPGQSVAIVGPSGSGKTTLLLMLAGLEQPESGTIRLQGMSLGSLDADALADLRRDRVGIVFQSFHLIPSLSALDNVALPLEIAGEGASRQRASEMLGRVGLSQRERHLPAQLSGGEQQRVAIARALVHRPALVLADEPTGNLDKQTGAQVSQLLFELLRESGATLVMATHDALMASRCDRTLALDGGRLLEQEYDAIPA